MSTVQEIESAIEHLPADQKWGLLQRLHGRLWEDWDSQIESDFNEGRFDGLLSEVESDIAAGRVKPLDEVIGNK